MKSTCFFFQAEDGIRCTSVTGVQTCALPIWSILDSRIDLLAGGGNLSAVYTKGHPSLFQPAVFAYSRRFDSRSDRLSVSYIIGKGAWTSESRFGYNRNKLFREDGYIDLFDPSKPETI